MEEYKRLHVEGLPIPIVNVDVNNYNIKDKVFVFDKYKDKYTQFLK